MTAPEKPVTRSWMPQIVSLLVITVAMGVDVWIITHGLPPAVSDFVSGRILGTFDTLLGVAVTYWIGTTRNSANKDETIATQAATAQAAQISALK